MRLGPIEAVREQYHREEGIPLLECFYQDARFTLRQIRKSPGFGLIAVLTMMLGIGATTAIFTIFYATLLRSLPYPEADRIVRIHDVRLQGPSTGGLVGVPRFFDLVARSKSLASAAFIYFDDTDLIAGSQLPSAIKGAGVNAGFWQVFGVNPLLGRTFNERDDQPNAPMVAVLSYAAWQRLFGGDPDVIGRQVTIEQKSTTIVGVMPKEFSVPAGIDLWRPAQFTPKSWTWRGEDSRSINVLARLAPGVSIGSAQSDLRRISGTPYGWERDMLRLILATLFRAGEIEVTYQGNRFHNYQDPASRTPFPSNTAFRSSLFSPRQSVGLKALTEAVKQLETLTGREVDVEEGAVAAAFKKVAADELEMLYPLKATAEANYLPIVSFLSEFQQTLLGIQAAASDDCVRILNENGPQFAEGRERVRKLRESLDSEAIELFKQSRFATEQVWQRFAPHCTSPEIAKNVEVLKTLLISEQFIDSRRSGIEFLQSHYLLCHHSGSLGEQT